MAGVVPALEVLLAEKAQLVRGARLGLITNHTGLDRQLRSNIDLLRTCPGVRLRAIFSPEHGLAGSAGAGERVSDGALGRVPVYSLYGNARKPLPETLEGLDVLVFDIQDAGARFYTYSSTMALAMEAAAEAGVGFVVLDRPNPLNGVALEGNILDERWRSFVGLYPIPVRHGMTLGELALMFHGEFRTGNRPEVVAMKGWRRDMWYNHTGLIWVPPSPNLNCLEAAALYPGICLIEGTNLSEGRGTTLPFQVAGAPWIDEGAWAARLNKLRLPGVLFRPVRFTPSASKHRGLSCGGVQIHITRMDQLRPVETGLHILKTAREMWPEEFEWVPYEKGGPFIDLLAGTDGWRLAIDEGRPVAGICSGWASGIRAFREQRSRYLLYPGEVKESP